LDETQVTEETLLKMAAGTDDRGKTLIGQVRKQFEPYWSVYS
jgi:hypothetical protein